MIGELIQAGATFVTGFLGKNFSVTLAGISVGADVESLAILGVLVGAAVFVYNKFIKKG